MIGLHSKVVLLSGLENDVEPLMRFRLCYEGDLRPTQRDALGTERDKLAPHKQQIRRCFHRQLKHLWETNEFLRESRRRPDGNIGVGEGRLKLSEYLASQYQKFGYRFVPLVIDELSLLCSLEMLFLRRDVPGSVIVAGDIDNRIKTLIDALRAPKSPNELVGSDATPSPDDDPFYCLLWDDRQVTHFSVETDMLLDPLVPNDADQRKVRVIITVDLRPYNVSLSNLDFVGS
jgi:hypothetical protein